MEEFDFWANELQEKENLVNGFLGSKNFNEINFDSEEEDSTKKTMEELYGKDGMGLTNTFQNLLRSPQIFSPGSGGNGFWEDDEWLLDSWQSLNSLLYKS